MSKNGGASSEKLLEGAIVVESKGTCLQEDGNHLCPMLFAHQTWSWSFEVEERTSAWQETARADIKPYITVCKLPNGVTEFRWQA